MEYSVIFYEFIDGTKPLSMFLVELRRDNNILYIQLLEGLRRLKHRENHGKPLTDKVDGTNGIYELRVGGKDIARVFFFFQPNQRIICTSGYVKKSMKLDPKEINRAEQYKREWEERSPS